MFELGLPRTPRFLINTVVLAILLFAVYYLPLSPPSISACPVNDGPCSLQARLNRAYYDNFWQDAQPKSEKDVELQILWPRYVSNLASREIVINLTNNTRSTISPIIVLTANAFSEPISSSQQWLIWQSELDYRDDRYDGRSVLTLGDIPAMGQVTRSVLVRLSPAGGLPEKVIFDGYVEWDCLDCNFGANPAKAEINSSRTLLQGVVKLLLLPPLTNLFIPLQALFLALSYEGVVIMVKNHWDSKQKLPTTSMIRKMLVPLVKFGRFLWGRGQKVTVALLQKPAKWRILIYLKDDKWRQVTWLKKVAAVIVTIGSFILLPVTVLIWLVTVLGKWFRQNWVYLIGFLLLCSYGSWLLRQVIDGAIYLLTYPNKVDDVDVAVILSGWTLALTILTIFILVYVQGDLSEEKPKLYKSRLALIEQSLRKSESEISIIQAQLGLVANCRQEPIQPVRGPNNDLSSVFDVFARYQIEPNIDSLISKIFDDKDLRSELLQNPELISKFQSTLEQYTNKDYRNTVLDALDGNDADKYLELCREISKTNDRFVEWFILKEWEKASKNKNAEVFFPNEIATIWFENPNESFLDDFKQWIESTLSVDIEQEPPIMPDNHYESEDDALEEPQSHETPPPSEDKEK